MAVIPFRLPSIGTRGIVALNGTEMHEGDGAVAESESAVQIEADAEVLPFDLG
jgi:hypothetical protein